MIPAERFCGTLIGLGYDVATGVPDSTFEGVIRHFSSTPGLTYIPAANEGSALALASGVVMAGGKAAVFLQNSGLGNLVNPLTSLSLTYGIPCLIFVCTRGGDERLDDGPQHVAMGKATAGLLREMTVPFWTLSSSGDDAETLIVKAEAAVKSGRPAFLLVPPGTIGPFDSANGRTGAEAAQGRPLRRDQAVRVIAEWVDEHYVVGTTGYISRELFGRSHRTRNFYMQGSMGHAAAIGLGLAITQPRRDIVVMDGDGALLMHLGILSTIGAAGAPNLTHIVLDNGAYESTGGQPTTAPSTRFEEIALACGYQQGVSVKGEDELREALEHDPRRGPRLIRVLISCQGEPPTGWATESASPEELQRRFRESFQAEEP